MAIPDIERRLQEALREKSRLEMMSGRMLQDLARLERNRIDAIEAIRKKCEADIEALEAKLSREINDTKKGHDRAEALLRSNTIMVMNAERELDNAKKNEVSDQVRRRRTL